MKKLKTNISHLRSNLIFVLLFSIIIATFFVGFVQKENLPFVQKNQVFSSGNLNLSVNSTFKFFLDVDHSIPNNYLSYKGYIKVLASVQLLLHKNSSLTPGYELELSLTNPVRTQKIYQSDSNPDGLSRMGCPTRVIHVLITQEGRVVGIPFYGIQCPDLNSSFNPFGYSYFIFSTNDLIPPLENQSSSSFFELLYNMSTRNYWDDWENSVTPNSNTTIFDLKNSMYFWNSEEIRMSYIDPSYFVPSSSFSSGTPDARDPWSPMFYNSISNNTGLTFYNYYLILAKQVFSIWNSSFYYFPFFQAPDYKRTDFFHCGLASTSFFENNSEELIINFANVTIARDGLILAQQFKMNTTYSYQTGYPQSLMEYDKTSSSLYESFYQFY